VLAVGKENNFKIKSFNFEKPTIKNGKCIVELRPYGNFNVLERETYMYYRLSHQVVDFSTLIKYIVVIVFPILLHGTIDVLTVFEQNKFC
jgi:hypothetical protein